MNRTLIICFFVHVLFHSISLYDFLIRCYQRLNDDIGQMETLSFI